MMRILINALLAIVAPFVMIGGEIAFFYFTITKSLWFWLAVGLALPPAGPVIGLYHFYGWIGL